MQRIIIHDFGPIKYFETEIKQLTCFIGQQASGKSTISKSIYFFKSLRDDLIDILTQAYQSNDDYSQYKIQKELIRKIKEKFLNYWGSTFHLDSSFSMTYYYSEDIFLKIKITKDEKFIDPIFCNEFENRLSKITINLKDIYNNTNFSNYNLIDNDFITMIQEMATVNKQIRDTVCTLFQDSRDLLFIPAGRSLITILSDQLHKLDLKKTDALTSDFVERVLDYRKKYVVDIEEKIKEYKYFNDVNNITDILKAKDIIETVLHGKYLLEGGQEKILFRDRKSGKKKYAKINLSSSGQQEALWILLIAFDQILRNRSTFIIIEEPEAHLFPTAQYEVIKLIMLLANTNNSIVIITTHSPYVLGSLNNLFYAYSVGIEQKNKIEPIIPECFWKNPDTASSFLLKNGIATSVLRADLKQIELEQLDEAGDVMLNEYNQIFEVDAGGLD